MNYGEILSSFLIDLQSLFRKNIKIENASFQQLIALSIIPSRGIEMTPLAKKIGIDNVIKRSSIGEYKMQKELVKLANNSFRDLSFAFSNELVNIADRFNLSLNDTIKKANKDYPRNRIPISSPGVGGYCLTKDPYLMSFPYGSKKRQLKLSYFGRKINSNAAYYPIKIIKKFCDKEKL